MGGKVEVPMEFKIQLLYDDGKTWMDSKNHPSNGSFESTCEVREDEVKYA